MVVPILRNRHKGQLQIIALAIIGFIYIGSTDEPPTDRRRAELEDVVTRWSGPDAEAVFIGETEARP